MVVVHAGVEDRDHRALALRAEIPGARVARPARSGRPRRAGRHGCELGLRQEAEVVPLLRVVRAVGLVAEQRVVRLAGVEPAGAARRAARGRCSAGRSPASCRGWPRARRLPRTSSRGSRCCRLRRRQRARCPARRAGRTACRQARRSRVGGVVGQRRVELCPANARRALQPSDRIPRPAPHRAPRSPRCSSPRDPGKRAGRARA